MLKLVMVPALTTKSVVTNNEFAPLSNFVNYVWATYTKLSLENEILNHWIKFLKNNKSTEIGYKVPA